MFDSGLNDGDSEIAEEFERAQTERRIADISGLLVLEGDDICQDCGGPVGAKRRAALPSATRCISCQGAYEARRGR